MPVASLVILGANIVTLNAEQPKAKAIAIRNGRIVAVGSNSEIRKHVGMDTKIVNANGKTLVPGLVDCHVHMTGFGFFLQSPDLKNVQSIKEMQRMLQEHASKSPGKSWLLGGRWDHEKLAEKRYPNRWDLDTAVPDRPVFLVRVCGHIGLANSEALRIAAITEKTVVEGGEIELNETSGQPNGILKENAMRLIWKKVPKPSLKDIEEASLLACTKAVEAGLTGVHWITDSADEIQAILNIDSEGKLPLRVHLGVPPKLLERHVNLHLSTRDPNSKVKMGFVKLFADGSLGSRTAALKEPYSDEPSSKGLLLHPKKELFQLVLAAHKTGQHLAIHAIGDRAIENVLDAYKEALKQYPRKDHRHRIEHCSILNPELIKRLKTLGLIASVQPHFIVSDFWLVDRVGKERARTAFPFKTLTKEGVLVISGSDCPVEKISPLLGIWAAVAQRGSEEGLNTEQALKTYTVNAAYASFDETERGTIEVGKQADFTILSDDLMSVEPDKIKNIKVETTVVNGEIVYSHKDSTGVNVE